MLLLLLLVEWLYYSKRIIIDKRADLTDFFSLIFVCKMCVFLSRPMKIATFLLKNRETAKRVVDFPLERDTIRNKIMEIVEDFDEKSYNNNGKTGNRRGFSEEWGEEDLPLLPRAGLHAEAPHVADCW